MAAPVYQTLPTCLARLHWVPLKCDSIMLPRSTVTHHHFSKLQCVVPHPTTQCLFGRPRRPINNTPFPVQVWST